MSLATFGRVLSGDLSAAAALIEDKLQADGDLRGLGSFARMLSRE